MAADLACQRIALAKIATFGLPGAGDRGWALVDAGSPGFSGRAAAAARFGEGARPAAIILAHAHFDRVALPAHARYAERPACAEDGSAYVRKPWPAAARGFQPGAPHDR